MLSTLLMLLLMLVISPHIMCQEDAKTALQKMTLKDTSKYEMPFDVDPSTSIGEIKQKIAGDLGISADTLVLEIVQKGTLKGTGKVLSENGTRFNHYQPLVQAGYTELLVYSSTEPDIKLDPKKRVPVAETKPQQPSSSAEAVPSKN